jgi:hypothetical protein
MAGSSSSTVHAVSSKVWVRDDVEGWVKGEVRAILKDGSVEVALEGGQQRKVPQDEAPLQNNDVRGVEVGGSVVARGAL